jgi:superfamily II DNA or RNA helicase
VRVNLASKSHWSEQELRELCAANRLALLDKVVCLDIWTDLKERVVLRGEHAQLEVDPGKGWRPLQDADWVGSGWVCLDRVIYRMSDEAESFQQPKQITEEALKGWSRNWKITGEWSPQLLPVIEIHHMQGHLIRAWLEGPQGQSSIAGTHFEQDLLALGYVRRGLQGDYGCETTVASEVLELLVSAGWALRHRGRPVRPQTALSIRLEGQGCLEGTVSFADQTVPLEQAWGNPSSILCATPGGWGLLSRHDCRAWVKQSAGGLRLPGGLAASSIMQSIEIQPSARDWMGLDVPQSPHADFRGELRTYQLEGMRWILGLIGRGGGGLLADEMGLGKTVQVLAALSHVKGPVLLVVPASLLENWRRECQRFLPLRKVWVHHGLSRDPDEQAFSQRLCDDGVVLTTPGVIRVDEWLRPLAWSLVVIDEAQLLKNHEAKTTQAIHGIKAKARLALTGTPLENRPEELWTHLRFLDHELAGDRLEFVARYSSETGRAMLRGAWAGWMKRRRKQDVARDLPPVLEQVVTLQLSEDQRGHYEAIRRGENTHDLPEASESGREGQQHILARLTALRQLCLAPLLLGLAGESPKLDRLMSDLDESLESGQAVLVFSQFVDALKLAARECPYPSRILSGDTPDRQKIVDEFQRGDVSILFCSLKAAGVGLNLQRADLVILLEPWWNRAAEQQAIDRAHRIGRTSPVLVKRYLMADSIEEKIAALQLRKLEWAEAWWGGDEAWAEELQDLLASKQED